MSDQPTPTAYYRRLDDDTFEPLAPTQGAWRTDEQHMAPVTGLLVHALDRHEPREDLVLARLSVDILGFIPALPTRVRTRTLRAGRSIELVEAVATVQGRQILSARAWRLVRGDTSAVAGLEEEPLPPPDDIAPYDASGLWPGGYIASLDLRPVENRPGRGRGWLGTPLDLIDGEDASPHARLLGLADTANGIVPRVSPREWMFPNTDLTVHLYRLPTGSWLGLDTSVSIGEGGVGLTSSVLHDLDGPCGRMEQILTVRPIPASAKM